MHPQNCKYEAFAHKQEFVICSLQSNFLRSRFPFVSGRHTKTRLTIYLLMLYKFWPWISRSRRLLRHVRISETAAAPFHVAFGFSALQLAESLD